MGRVGQGLGVVLRLSLYLKASLLQYMPCESEV